MKKKMDNAKEEKNEKKADAKAGKKKMKGNPFKKARG